MKESKKESSLREFRKVWERIQEINNTLRRKPAQKLAKKIFAGHWRFLVVREDILRSSIGREVSEVVDACNQWVLGRKKVPESYRCSTEVRYGPDSSGFTQGQGLRPLNAEAFEQKNFPSHYKRKWFEEVRATRSYGSKNVTTTRFFPKIPSYMLEFGYKAAYITEVYNPDGDLESELAHLHRYMELHDGWKKIFKIRRDDWDLSVEKKKELRKLREREARDAAADDID